MASSSVIAEFGKKKPIVKVSVFFGIAVVLGLLYYQLVFSGVRKDVSAAEVTRDGLIAQDASVKRDEKEYKDLKKQQGELARTIDENDDALPTASQLPAFFDMLNRKVGEASVEVRRWEYQKEIPVDDFIKVPVVIELQGSFQEIKKFFYLLYKMSQKEGEEAGAGGPAAPGSTEDRDRILTIEDLSISRPVVRNNELLLTATFRASTFRQEAKEPVIEVKPKAKDDKKASSRGATTKDKVGAAMDPSEERAGGADAERPAGTDQPAGGSDAVKKGM